MRAGMGAYAGFSSLSQLPAPTADAVRAAMDCERPEHILSDLVAVPLRTREGDRGCIVVKAGTITPDCGELCQIYSRMVVQALENLVLYDRATHDPLCRIWNRSAGLRRLTECLKLAHRDGQPTSLILLDVDHFKQVNDRWGHAGGDMALVAIAQAMVGACRETDVVSRYGGEEFLVVLPSTGRQAAGGVAEKLRARIAALDVPFEGTRIPLTASFGVASIEVPGERPLHPEGLIRAADEAMYRAKKAGRDRVEFATSVSEPAP